MGLENPVADHRMQAEEIRRLDLCEAARQTDDPSVSGAPVGAGAAGDEAAAALVAPPSAAQWIKPQVVDQCAGKRKRGRPPRCEVKPPPPKIRKEEEDVCFICFDGGNLVLCDRRGCPKAYHPTCVKRDEAFFQSIPQWNCGWHICSICEKAAQYMCYTCTYSLCKACISRAEIFCVRGNKGFCNTCMRIVLLIENIVQGDEEMGQVDFDDKSNWEHLFKLYWLYLKDKLSLSLDELIKAKNPWKKVDFFSRKGEASGEHCEAGNDSFSSEGTFRGMVGIKRKRKMGKPPKIPIKVDAGNVVEAGVDCRASLPACAQWASKELLEFVAYMKDGDTSILSQFDVQDLLLEYIKRNNLCDSHHKSQIVCDFRLRKLFGKSCTGLMGLLELLKLLEAHFLTEKDSQVDCMWQGCVDNVTSCVVSERNNKIQPSRSKNKRQKTCKKDGNRGQPTNLDDCAPIDVHNVNLIYIRRGLMEFLIEDAGSFPDMAVGAVVRIRISTFLPEQDMYRLVQVVGISKAAVPYKVGQRTTDMMLQILNFDKIEAISIDAISNQEFSEDECRRLQQSTKDGLVKHFTVGELQEKATALQKVKLSAAFLESEVLRHGCLCDPASANGHMKNLRENLTVSEECHHSPNEVPKIRSDSSINLSHESEENGHEAENEHLDVREECQHRLHEVPEKLSNSSINLSCMSEENGPQEHLNVPEECQHRLQEAPEKLPNSSINLSCMSAEENSLEPENKKEDLSPTSIISCDGGDLMSPDGGNDISKEIDREFQSTCEPNKNAANLELFAGAQGSSNQVSLNQSRIAEKSSNLEEPENHFSGSVTVGWNKQHESSSGQPPAAALEALISILSAEIASPVNRTAQDDGVSVREGKGDGCKGGGINLNFIDSRQSDGENMNDALVSPNDVGGFLRGYEHCSHSGWNFQGVLSNLNEELTGGDDFLGCSNSQPSPPSPVSLGKPDRGEDSGQDEERTSNSCGHSGQSSGENQKPSPPCCSSNGGASFTSAAVKSSVTSELQQRAIDFAEAASEWDSSLAPAYHPNPSPSEAAVNDQAATPTSHPPMVNPGQLTYSCLDASNWPMMVPGPNEFSSLGEESVSDLLAEVDAMELDGLHCSAEFAGGTQIDCFSSLEVLSPAPEPGKSDASSSTGDLELALRMTVMGAPEGSNRQSRSIEIAGETNRGQWENGPAAGWGGPCPNQWLGSHRGC